MGPSLTVEGATTSAVFEAYVEQVLAHPRCVRVSGAGDGQNLSAHKGERVRELIEERGCELIYLPSYSPDFNPIEEAFSKIKGLIRKAEARGCYELAQDSLRMRKTGDLRWTELTAQSAS